MPLLYVLNDEGEHPVSFEPGSSLRDILDTTDLKVRSGCDGSGACGLCRIRIVGADSGNGTTANEALLLSKEDLRQGVRLACQVVPWEEMRIRIVSPAPLSGWKRLTIDDPTAMCGSIGTRGRSVATEEPCYGVAVDLGTTNIGVSLWDLGRGRRLSTVLGPNRQFLYGSDVVTRLVAASGSAERATEIAKSARDAVADALLHISSREGYDLRKTSLVAIVGNTAMTALLAGRNSGLLLIPEYWTKEVDCRPEESGNWFEACGIDGDAVVEVIQPLAGFVGSDLLAAVLSTGLTEGPAGSLLIDFGTNSEIALWDGKTLMVTSAAGGPAFEGSGTACGMAAEPGAIYRVYGEDGSLEPAYGVIGDIEAKGLCGSGLVDLIAHLLKADVVNTKGKFTSEGQGKGLGPFAGALHIQLEPGDIDLFQRAKAAIGAGVRVLLNAAGMAAGGISRVCVCGAFGRHLDVHNAMAVGLLPSTSPDRVELCSNAALTGCELLLLASDRMARLDSLRGKSRLINLAQVAEFEDLFLESLYLRPLKAD